MANAPRNPNELRITNVDESLKQTLTNMAKHEEMCLSPFLKKKLKAIADSAPLEMKQKRV